MNIYLPFAVRLPSAYQEVEYIESSGTQYIKIGKQFKTSYKTVIDFQMTVTGGDYVPIGVRTADGGNKRYGIDVWNSYFKVIAGGGDWNNTIAEDTNRHRITLDKSTAIVDGTSYSVQYVDYTFNDGIGVFYYHRIGETPDCISSNKLYKLDIYDENGTHIYDLIPCYRKSDSVIGLYDLVNNQFYTNSGTGTFSKGADVNMTELKNDYIGEYVPPFEYYYDFRGKTKTQVTNDGWEGDSGTSCGSNGLYPTSQSSGGSLLKEFNIDMTNAKKITIEAQIYTSNTSSRGGSFGTVQSRSGSNQIRIYLANNSKFMTICGTDTSISTTLSGNTYKWKLVLDLDNKTYTTTFLTGSSYTDTGSLTDSQVTSIKTHSLFGEVFVRLYGYIQTINTVVEF